MTSPQRIVVGITGATGPLIGMRILEQLKQRPNVETHLIMSPWARRTLEYETGLHPSAVEALADHSYKANDMWSPIASGSFKTEGMIIAPCSMRTLASIATGTSDTLIARAADVILKEKRRLVLVARETPLNAIHIENMKTLSQLGAIIMPPVMTFYNQPSSIDDMVNHLVQRVMDQLGMTEDIAPRWEGRTEPATPIK